MPQIPSTNQYAQISDLPLYGLPATALQSPALTPAVLNAALQAASAEMDSYFSGRYQLPLLTWDTSVTEVCCKITAYHLRDGTRGVFTYRFAGKLRRRCV